jgi:hypothetical protein
MLTYLTGLVDKNRRAFFDFTRALTEIDTLQLRSGYKQLCLRLSKPPVPRLVPVHLSKIGTGDGTPAAA